MMKSKVLFLAGLIMLLSASAFAQMDLLPPGRAEQSPPATAEPMVQTSEYLEAAIKKLHARANVGEVIADIEGYRVTDESHFISLSTAWCMSVQLSQIAKAFPKSAHGKSLPGPERINIHLDTSDHDDWLVIDPGYAKKLIDRNWSPLARIGGKWVPEWSYTPLRLDLHPKFRQRVCRFAKATTMRDVISDEVTQRNKIAAEKAAAEAATEAAIDAERRTEARRLESAMADFDHLLETKTRLPAGSIQTAQKRKTVPVNNGVNHKPLPVRIDKADSSEIH